MMIILITYFSIQKTKAKSMKEYREQPVADVENGNRAKERIPEPENQVDFLVDDVLQTKYEYECQATN